MPTPQGHTTQSAHNELLVERIGELTAEMARRHLADMEEKKEAKTNETTRKFDALPPIVRNITIMCTMVPGMEQEDLQEITPTEAWNSFIGLKSGTYIQSTLQHVLRSKGCLVYLQNGMCNEFRHGTIASYPDPFERNGLCIFLMSPEETKQVKADRLRELEEKSA